MPPINFIWGIMMKQPYLFDEGKKEKEKVGLPSFNFIRKEICDVFDTNKRIQADNTLNLQHIVAECTSPNCSFHKILHV